MSANDDETQEIKDYIEKFSIEAIIEVYLEENCFSEIVDCLVKNLNKKLSALESIEEVLNEMKVRS